MNTTITKENLYKICFVCLGNICRSPTAEGIFRHLVNERSLQAYFEIDSAGTSAYHVGEPANSKSRKIASQNGISLQSRARRFELDDLSYFDQVLAMDYQNLSNIQLLDTDNKHDHKIGLLREYDPEAGEDLEVPDPYAGGIGGFEHVFEVVQRSCRNLLDELENQVDGEK